jgi:pyrimidine-nucleoside phosphorylase
MNNPLGKYVGNALEVIEAVETLKGKGPDDIMELTLILAEQMLKIAGIRGGQKKLLRKITNGEALLKFKQIIEYQNGNSKIIEDYTILPTAKHHCPVKSRKNGYINDIDNHQIGMLLIELGGGRKKKEDSIDPSCGFRIHKKIGDRVKKNEMLAEVHSNDRSKASRIADKLAACYTIKSGFCASKKLIKEIV